MKRIFTIIMIGILLVGCAKTDSLTEHDWVHYDTTCIETIYFGKDGHFAYYSDEGNVVLKSMSMNLDLSTLKSLYVMIHMPQ